MRKEISNKEVGYRILTLRMDLGLSRESLAEMAGISSKFLFEIERNEKGFSAHTLINLAEALGVSGDFIMTGRSFVQFNEGIVATLEKFEPSKLEQLEKLLDITYDMTRYK